MGHLSGYGVPLNCSEHIQHNYAYGFITACNFVEGNRIAELFFATFLQCRKTMWFFFQPRNFFQVKFCKLFFPDVLQTPFEKKNVQERALTTVAVFLVPLTAKERALMLSKRR